MKKWLCICLYFYSITVIAQKSEKVTVLPWKDASIDSLKNYFSFVHDEIRVYNYFDDPWDTNMIDPIDVEFIHCKSGSIEEVTKEIDERGYKSVSIQYFIGLAKNLSIIKKHSPVISLDNSNISCSLTECMPLGIWYRKKVFQQATTGISPVWSSKNKYKFPKFWWFAVTKK